MISLSKILEYLLVLTQYTIHKIRAGIEQKTPKNGMIQQAEVIAYASPTLKPNSTSSVSICLKLNSLLRVSRTLKIT